MITVKLIIVQGVENENVNNKKINLVQSAFSFTSGNSWNHIYVGHVTRSVKAIVLNNKTVLLVQYKLLVQPLRIAKTMPLYFFI